MSELIKLLPEGSAVVAVIVVVLLFLKQQREQEKRYDTITAAFNTRLSEITKNFQDQIDKLATQFFDYQNENQVQIRQLFDGFMNVSKETVSAVIEMKASIEALTNRLNQIRNQDEARRLENK